MTTKKIPPQSEWASLSIGQLYQLKSDMADMYYNAQRAGASYANQYLKFLNDVDNTISRAELKAQMEKEQREKLMNSPLSENELP